MQRFIEWYNLFIEKCTNIIENSTFFQVFNDIVCYKRVDLDSHIPSFIGLILAIALTVLFPFLNNIIILCLSVLLCITYFVFETDIEFSIFDMIIILIIVFFAPHMALLYLPSKHFIKKRPKLFSVLYLITCSIGATFSIFGMNEGLYTLALPVAYDLFLKDKNLCRRIFYVISAILLIANMSINWQVSNIGYLLFTILYVFLATRSGMGKIMRALLALSGLSSVNPAVGYVLFISIASGNVEKDLLKS